MKRRVVVSLFLLFALAFVSMPANAGSPKSTAAATITDNGHCSFTVTYTWSGFSGTGLQAELAIGYKLLGGANATIDWAFIAGQAGSSGSVSATFTVSGESAPHEFFGSGNLFKVGKNQTDLTPVRGAFARSGYLAAQVCP